MQVEFVQQQGAFLRSSVLAESELDLGVETGPGAIEAQQSQRALALLREYTEAEESG